MTAVTLLQTGIVKHLPDPPIGNFDSDRELVRYAFRLGAPGGSISLANLVANIPIAALAAPIACKPLASAGRSAESGG